MEQKLILNKDSKEFVYIGYFYGHIEQNKVIVQSSNEQVCFDIEKVQCMIGKFDLDYNLNEKYALYKIRLFAMDDIDSEMDFEQPGLYTYTSGFAPDLVFQSKTLLLEFYNFINSYE